MSLNLAFSFMLSFVTSLPTKDQKKVAHYLYAGSYSSIAFREVTMISMIISSQQGRKTVLFLHCTMT